jgi:hypothetical protein
MALLEDTIGGLVEGGAATGLAIGAGVVLLAPTLLPAIGRILRPVAVGAIKAGMVVYNQTAATLREATEGIIAEARAEIAAERSSTPAEPVHRDSHPAAAHS